MSKLVEASQDIKTAYEAGKWMAIIGTGYLLAKNPRMGWAVLTRSAWAVATAGVRLGITITQIWWQEVFRPVIFRPPPAVPKPPPGKGPIIDMKKTPSGTWKPERAKGGSGFRPPPGGAGGATAFFLFGGLLVQSVVNANEVLEDWLDGDEGEFADVR